MSRDMNWNRKYIYMFSGFIKRVLNLFFPGLSIHVCIKIGSTCKAGDLLYNHMHHQQPRIMICWVWIWFNPAAHTRQIWDRVGCWWTAISDDSNMLCYHQLLIDLTHCVLILQITFNQMKQHTDLKNKTKKNNPWTNKHKWKWSDKEDKQK